MTLICHIRVDFEFGCLDCVCYNRDFIIPGFVISGNLLFHTFYSNLYCSLLGIYMYQGSTVHIIIFNVLCLQAAIRKMSDPSTSGIHHTKVSLMIKLPDKQTTVMSVPGL